MPPLTADQVEEAAQQLASIPDRVQQLPEVLVLLQPACFVQQVLQQALQFLSSSSSSITRSGDSSADSSSTEDASVLSQAAAVPAAEAGALPGATAFVARLMQKLLTRGYAKHVAAALLQLLADQAAQPAAAAAEAAAVLKLLLAMQLVLLQLSSHTPATEKLLVQLLRQACMLNPLQLQQHNTSNHGSEQQCDHHHLQQQVKALLCPLLVLVPNLRGLATHRLLLGRTLPANCLQLLLDVLASCQPSLVPAAAVDLAQAWSEQQTCQNVSVQQQAYMTAALAACIELLPREVLDPAAAATQAAAAAATASTSGRSTQFSPAALAAYLAAASPAAGSASTAAAVTAYEGVPPQHLGSVVPSILQGVSMRLASPSPAIRAQAMRVGRGFAAKLDPAKPLFEEAGELQLLPDELWPGAIGQQQQQQQPVTDEQSGIGGATANGDAAGSNALAADDISSSSSKFGALQRLQEAALEADSDDEEDTAAAAAAAAGRSSQQPQQKLSNGSNQAAHNNKLYDSSYGDDDSASEAGSEGSASSLVAFDLAEEPAADAWWGPDGLGLPEGKQLSLRGLAAALRKQDDVNGALEALSRVSEWGVSMLL
jgi:hypothetical protein